MISYKSGQTHKFLFGICTVVNDLSGSLTVDGIMNFILNFFEELDGDFCFWVVVNAGCIDLQNLTVEHFFGSTDVADTFQQFFEISTAAQIFQAFVIQRKSFAHIFF